MFGLLVIQLKDFLELLAVVVLPGLVGVIILLGKRISCSFGNRFISSFGNRFSCGLGSRFVNGLGSRLCGLNGLLGHGLGLRLVLGEGHAAHLGELAHLALDLIGDDLGRVLLTQSAGDEHQSLNLIDMRQHFLDRHIHNRLFYWALAKFCQGFALH